MSNLVSTNPAKDFEPIGEVYISTEKEIKDFVRRSKKVQIEWQKLTLKERIGFLRKVLEEFKNYKEKISLLTTQEIGRTIKQTTGDFGFVLDNFAWYLDNAEKFLSPQTTIDNETEFHQIHYTPKGVVAAIAPWNFPFLIFIWEVIPSLLVGNTVVFKMSEECPLSGKLYGDILKKYLPEDVFLQVFGGKEEGDILTNQEVDLIHFTGSTRIGRHLYEKSAKRFIDCVCELGGSNPGIIFEDADLEKVIPLVYGAKFLNNGQICDGLKRLIVHESLYEEVIQRLSKLLSNKKIGDPENMETDLGPLVSLTQKEKLDQQLVKALNEGAKIAYQVVLEGDLKGAFFPPMLLSNIETCMDIWNEEVFGPVLPIISFSSEEEAIEIANNTIYGLGAFVYTEDKARAKRVSGTMKAGTVVVNDANPWYFENPFGGVKLSGKGRENGAMGFHDLCDIILIADKK